jgi:nicotinamide-nucleotide amidase
VVTGGLGPTHDDVTREAAALAIGVDLVRDPALETMLAPWAARHRDARSSERIYVQADVLAGARAIPPTRGTAPGQIVPTARGMLVLLPGPPAEMRPMLREVSTLLAGHAAPPAVLRCAGITESDAQMAVQDALGRAEGVSFTVLAAPGDVRAVLYDRGIGADGLRALAARVAARLGDVCYSTDGSSLAEVVVRLASEKGLTVACAESCTGGMVAAAITDVPGSSDVFAGGVVAYADTAKSALLGIDPAFIAQWGAVSESVARAMASGALPAMSADMAVGVTGLAGPGGGSADKPVGTVWFALAGPDGVSAVRHGLPGDREGVRLRAVAVALDLLRRALAAR